MEKQLFLKDVNEIFAKELEEKNFYNQNGTPTSMSEAALKIEALIKRYKTTYNMGPLEIAKLKAIAIERFDALRKKDDSD
ncbi:hypothetical protein ACLI1A_00460 [Flavobacterium sp. RHBU_3]|uniref:hypothetical protein n=1 Tax=Flavobacterium sp. RHBU_3 TaxID=3391184 RepID=UPI0039855737